MAYENLKVLLDEYEEEPGLQAGAADDFADSLQNMVPVLQEIANSSPNPRVRDAALRQVERFSDYVEAYAARDIHALDRALDQLVDAEEDGALLAEEGRRCGVTLPSG